MKSLKHDAFKSLTTKLSCKCRGFFTSSYNPILLVHWSTCIPGMGYIIHIYIICIELPPFHRIFSRWTSGFASASKPGTWASCRALSTRRGWEWTLLKIKRMWKSMENTHLQRFQIGFNWASFFLVTFFFLNRSHFYVWMFVCQSIRSCVGRHFKKWWRLDSICELIVLFTRFFLLRTDLFPVSMIVFCFYFKKGTLDRRYTINIFTFLVFGT